MDDLRLYVLFNSISVISGRWTDDNEMLCAIEPCLRLKRSLPQAGFELSTVRSVEDYSRNISVKVCQNICNDMPINASLQICHYKSRVNSYTYQLNRATNCNVQEQFYRG